MFAARSCSRSLDGAPPEALEPAPGPETTEGKPGQEQSTSTRALFAQACSPSWNRSTDKTSSRLMYRDSLSSRPARRPGVPPGIRGFLATSRNSFEISAFRSVLKTRFLSLKTIGHPYCKGGIGVAASAGRAELAGTTLGMEQVGSDAGGLGGPGGSQRRESYHRRTLTSCRDAQWPRPSEPREAPVVAGKPADPNRTPCGDQSRRLKLQGGRS